MEIRFAILYHPSVPNKDLPALSQKDKMRIRSAIEQKLMTEPEIFGVPLRQSLKGHRKLRVGDYRIVFRMEKKVVYVIAILHRSIVYGEIGKRIS